MKTWSHGDAEEGEIEPWHIKHKQLKSKENPKVNKEPTSSKKRDQKEERKEKPKDEIKESIGSKAAPGVYVPPHKW